jgi:hypothetical protein
MSAQRQCSPAASARALGVERQYVRSGRVQHMVGRPSVALANTDDWSMIERTVAGWLKPGLPMTRYCALGSWALNSITFLSRSRKNSARATPDWRARSVPG